jgi:hypothetical protein
MGFVVSPCIVNHLLFPSGIHLPSSGNCLPSIPGPLPVDVLSSVYCSDIIYNMFAQSVLIKDLSKAQLSRVVMKKAVEMDQVDTNDENKMACHDSKPQSGPVLYSECDAFKTTRREITKILKARVQT